MSPFDLLGIGADADERTIKSAYAKLLRSTRPDEDAEGFQRLNEAYQRALAIWRVRNGASRNAWQQSPPVVVQFTGAQPAAGTNDRQDAAAQAHTPAEDRPNHPLPKPADATHWQTAQQAQPAFNFQAFLDRYRQHAEAGEPRILEEWLVAEPGLWHLPTKQAVGRHLLKVLFENPVPTTGECLDTTLDFFKLNDALSGVDPLALKRLKLRAIGAWHARSDLRSLAWQLYGSAASGNLLELRKIRVRCERPLHWSGALWRTLLSNRYTNRVAHILVKLCGGRLEDLPDAFDRRHARFWMEAVARDLNRTRLIIFAFRSAVALIAIPLLGFAVNLIASGGELDPDGIKATLMVTVGMTSSIVAAAWLWIGTGWAMREFDKLTYRSRIAKAVRIGFTPALCAGTLIIAQLMDATLGTVFAAAILLIAIWRFRSRHATGNGLAEQIWSAALITFGVGVFSSIFRGEHGIGLVPLSMIDTAALAFWALDMKKLYWRSFARRRAST